jgi:hypothetical protein
VTAVGAQVYSFGYPNDQIPDAFSGGPATNGPNVFIFAFGGVGGTAVACADAEAPCVRNPRKAPEPQDYTTEWKGKMVTSPGAGVVIDWTQLVQLNVHKESTTDIIGPCVPGPPPLSSAPFEIDQIVSLPDGTVLTPAQAKRATKRLLNDRKRLLRAQKTQRTVRLTADPSDGVDLTVKIFQFDPAALEIARDAGCAGVRINYTYTIVGQGIGGLLVPPVTGGDFVDWLVVEEP